MCSTQFSSLAGVQEKCSQDPTCGIIVSGCDGPAWRYCPSTGKGYDAACTKAILPVLSPAGHVATHGTTVFVLGSNRYGQLGLGTTEDYHPLASLAGPVDAKAVAAGVRHCLFLLLNGMVLAVGLNHFGELGLVGTSEAHKPTRIPGLEDVTDVAAGAWHRAE